MSTLALSKKQKKDLDQKVAVVNARSVELSIAADEYNRAVRRAWQKVVLAIDGLNGARDELAIGVEVVVAELTKTWDAQPPEWKNSSQGAMADAWLHTLEAYPSTIPEVSLTEPSMLRAAPFDLKLDLPLVPPKR
jgi:hypothetical protein